MSEHDDSQDWPLRDWSSRLRPPGGVDSAADGESGGAEILYDEDPVTGATAPAEAEAPQPPEAEAPQPPEADVVDEPEPEQAEPEAIVVDEAEPEAIAVEEAEPDVVTSDEPAGGEVADEPVVEHEPAAAEEHAGGAFKVPDGFAVLEGSPNGHRRAVAVVVSRFNGEITNRLLASALDELEEAGVARDAITVMPVPGAFELPIAAMALAKTRRYACVIALGCVIRGETPHFDFVASEAASGLQLAGIETGVPVSFGVLTCDTQEQAEARVDRGAWAARSALEMADAFARLRAASR
jgi:6,7-dimethyl-8-ribityllumazine synthase